MFVPDRCSRAALACLISLALVLAACGDAAAPATQQYFFPSMSQQSGAATATPSPTAEPKPAAQPAQTPKPAPTATPVPTPVPRKPGWGINVAEWKDLRIPYELGFDWIEVFLPPEYPIPPYKILYRVDLGKAVTGRQEEIDQFARVVEGVAYKSRGVIQAYQIGNEVNLSREWGGGQPDPVLYTRLLQIAHDKIKAVDPNAIVVSAGLAPTGGDGAGHADDLSYARQMLDAGAGNYFDVYGFHPYGFAYPPEQDPNAPGVNGLAFRRAEAHRALMEQYGQAGKQMWATEFGWLVDPQQEGGSCDWPDMNWQKVSLAQQADYARRAYDYAKANWPWMGVMFLWNYDFSRSPLYPNGCEQMKWFSILDPYGHPRPIVEALRP